LLLWYSSGTIIDVSWLTILKLQNLAIMLTSAFNQFINPWAISAIGWWYYIVYCAWLVIELIFVLIYVVETKGLLWLDGLDVKDWTQC